MKNRVSIIIVTHNSKQELEYCISSLRKQTLKPSSVTIVDSGSNNSEYLDKYCGGSENFSVIKLPNVGFAQANNHGYRTLGKDIPFIVFCNPDAFLDQEVLAKGLELMTIDPQTACVTGRMLGYDINSAKPTGMIDSCGIFRKWYGRWYDRGHGEVDKGQYIKREQIPAACGAFLLCRRSALDRCAVNNVDVFDQDFFMYKEDIELSLRLREYGWKILYDPELIVYHCRGWKKDRSENSLSIRRMAARNEITLYLKHPSVYILWGIIKYFLVSVFRV